MSRSNPPRSPIAEKLRRESSASGAAVPAHDRPLGRRVAIRVASLARWLHIYLSLFGLASVLFFSITGLTLNHPGWFFADRETRSESRGHVDPAWLRGSGSSADSAEGVKRLEVVEHLRKADGVRGAMTDFLADERECTVTFKGPGY